MNTKQWQVWAWVCLGVGLLLTAISMVGILVFGMPPAFLLWVGWGGGLILAFITAVRNVKETRRQREGAGLRARHG